MKSLIENVEKECASEKLKASCELFVDSLPDWRRRFIQAEL
jgi:hypothetical protein